MHVVLSALSIEWLREQRIFFENDPDRHRMAPGDILHGEPSTRLEPYCGILDGHVLWNAGAFSYSWSSLASDMSVGRYSSIAHGLTVPWPRHPIERFTSSPCTYDDAASFFRLAAADAEVEFPVAFNPQKPNPVIEHDVWIGANVTLMPGVTLGTGCVVAANAVVTRDVAPYMVVGGNPAHIVKPRFDEALVVRLLNSRWWRFNFTQFHEMAITDAHRFVGELEEAAGRLTPFEPERIGLADIPV